ncbi:MAG: RNA pseudouridine synthase [Halobacteriovoraceae bacterium]|nr:RNA pseudouridine synthase [Halobacteriovoraceae bacterium]
MNSPFPIEFQNKEFMVIDKPCGVSCHNGYESVVERLHIGNPDRNFHLVNRLDKDTSGLMMVAFNPEDSAKMQKILADSSTLKEYSAIVRGNVSTDEGFWEEPITDKCEGRKNPLGLKKERIEAKTIWKCVEKNQYFSRLHVEIQTGRQHQIRKHCAYFKHAIIGDKRYGDKKYLHSLQNKYGKIGLQLHCQKMAFMYNGHKVEIFKEPKDQLVLMKRSALQLIY